MRKLTLPALVAVAAVAVAVGAWYATAEDRGDAGRFMIDEQAGTFRGVRLGSSEPRVIRVLGEPDRSPGFAPAGENPSQAGVTQSIPAAGPGGLLKYNGVGFIATPAGTVYAFIVTQPSATTRKGVSIGDSMDEARRKYRVNA